MTFPMKRCRFFALPVLVCLCTSAAQSFADDPNSRQARDAAVEAIREVGGIIRMHPAEPSKSETYRVINVDLRKAKVGNEILKHVVVLKELTALDLSFSQVDDKGVEMISHLPLREFWLQSTKITDASAKILSEMKSLDFLQLNATSVSDRFLKDLKPLSKLKDLGLRGTKVTGEGMRHLLKHKKLAELDVYMTTVDDFGVEALIECESLKFLGISATKVTNVVFLHLAEFPNLRDVDLNGNRLVTTEAVKQFETAHPNCDIEWNGK